MTKQVLIVVHQERSTPGKVGEQLEARGYALDRRCPNLGDPLPADLSPYAATVVFGGPMSANDDHLPGIKAELDWLERTAIPADGPVLGICLGAQTDRARARRQGRPRPRWASGDRLLAGSSDRCRRALFRGLDHVLSMALRNLRNPARRGPSRGERKFRGPGVPLQSTCLWDRISSRDDARNDQSLVHIRERVRPSSAGPVPNPMPSSSLHTSDTLLRPTAGSNNFSTCICCWTPPVHGLMLSVSNAGSHRPAPPPNHPCKGTLGVVWVVGEGRRSNLQPREAGRRRGHASG